MKKALIVLCLIIVGYALIFKSFDLIFTLGTMPAPIERWKIFETIIPDIIVLFLSILAVFILFSKLIGRKNKF